MRSIDIQGAFDGVGGGECLFGKRELQIYPRRPFAKEVCDFLESFSKAIREDLQAREYSDIMTFSFWIRRANIQQMKQNWVKDEHRIGKGVVFHIAPSNVPINFVYTLVFGLLAGNSNIVKVSTKKFPQTEILCRIMKQIVCQECFSWVECQNAVILYQRSRTELTDFFSQHCDARVIWGGDKTIMQIRKIPIKPRAAELTFADRYSLAIISADKMLQADSLQLQRIAKGFYNDTYLMDQNACSSPHFICWLGTEKMTGLVQERFWQEVYKCAKNYDLTDGKASEKYTMLCEISAQIHTKKIKMYDNLLYVLTLDRLPENVVDLRGKFGMFFECMIEKLEDVVHILDDNKIQTCAVYGVDNHELEEVIIKHHIQGIDRIVPIGKTLDIDIIWDGYDVIAQLSRCIYYG